MWGTHSARFWSVKAMFHYVNAGLEWSSEQIFTFWLVCPFVIEMTSREATGAVCIRTVHLMCGWIESPPYRWREKNNPFLGPPSGLTQALSVCSDAGVKAHKFYYFSVGLFIFCHFLGYFPLSIPATDSYIVLGCLTFIWEYRFYLSLLPCPCFSMVQRQVLPYLPPGCGKSRDVVRRRGIDISK